MNNKKEHENKKKKKHAGRDWYAGKVVAIHGGQLLRIGYDDNDVEFIRDETRIKYLDPATNIPSPRKKKKKKK